LLLFFPFSPIPLGWEGGSEQLHGCLAVGWGQPTTITWASVTIKELPGELSLLNYIS